MKVAMKNHVQDGNNKGIDGLKGDMTPKRVLVHIHMFL